MGEFNPVLALSYKSKSPQVEKSQVQKTSSPKDQVQKTQVVQNSESKRPDTLSDNRIRIWLLGYFLGVCPQGV